MAFTRSFLKASGLTDEQITAVMEEHVAVTDALKQQRDGYKAEADKAADLQRQLEDIKGGEDFKAKFESEHKAFEDFKAKTAADAVAAKVRAAYRKLLIDEKIGEKQLDAVLKATDLTGVKLGEDGRLLGEEELRKRIDDDWGNLRTTITVKGADVATPPAAGHPDYDSMSDADYYVATYEAAKKGK